MSEPTFKAFELLQEGVRKALKADPFFADLGVLTENIEDFEYKIELTLARIGIAILITTPVGDIESLELSRGVVHLDPVHVVVRIEEDVTLNQKSARGTKKKASHVALVSLCLLNNLPIDVIGETCNLNAKKPNSIVLAAQDPSDEKVKVIYDVHFTTRVTIEYPPKS